ncbi:hypothetical protein D7X55_11285 [Corallococcus sp. AB049A]|uniref:Uncharacterized protein n=1 Tax=Corallococcus interemptor TaxID=2316720 RepID=A0A3A8Q860_9BACT|nr:MULTISPECIES: hypothetical protein [Corallococcus]RKH64857.1 hypothetical protein D7X96_24820 [Corallococcus interemptor]RKI69469.1 hypothetical protein D7X55_11285 [Corallococcus sp. AB049A]
MTTRSTLTDLMHEVSSRNGDWASPRDLGVDRVTVVAAWLSSDDPAAMLLLLAALHPKRQVETCVALATRMSFFEPMRVEAHSMSRRLPGMNFNGRSPFYFIHLYQLLRSALQVTEDTERPRLKSELAAAIRAVIPEPFTLVGPAA